MIAWDIETGPLPDDQLETMLPDLDVEAAVPLVGDFDPASVKIGNLKDSAKITAKVDAAREAHRNLQRGRNDRVKDAMIKHWEHFKSKAALSAITGQVLAVGWMDDDELADDAIKEPAYLYVHDKTPELPGVNEIQLIERWWRVLDENRTHNFIGFNINGFDLPFLVRRSWILGIEMPSWIMNGRYWSTRFVDLLELWLCGQRGAAPILDNKLDTIAKAFGLGGKTEGVSGADFAQLLVDDRKLAIEYLQQDVRLTMDLAEQMGVM